MEKDGEEKDQSLPSGGKRREMRKRLDHEVKDQRISNFNCCWRSALFSEINDPFHLFSINILIQHIFLDSFSEIASLASTTLDCLCWCHHHNHFRFVGIQRTNNAIPSFFRFCVGFNIFHYNDPWFHVMQHNCRGSLTRVRNGRCIAKTKVEKMKQAGQGWNSQKL